jgi:hypothetical protein
MYDHIFRYKFFETYTLACPTLKISQFIIYKPSNIIYTSFIFIILPVHTIYKYQGGWIRNPYDENRMKIQTENFFRSLISTRLQQYVTQSVLIYFTGPNKTFIKKDPMVRVEG